MLTILDGFSGSGSAMAPLAESGHKVVGFDLIPGPHTVVADIFDIAMDPVRWCKRYLGRVPNHFHFSFPCETWAVGAVSTHWNRSKEGIYTPKSKRALEGIEILMASLSVAENLRRANPDMTFSGENPAGIAHKWLRQEKNWIVQYEHIISYCAFGPIGPVDVLEGPRMVYAQKTTIIWTNLKHFEARRCIARPPKARIVDGPYEYRQCGIQFVERDGKPCHENAYRGARRGVQRIKSAGHRAIFPQAFAEELCATIEEAHA